jgi:hypothetical protein
MTKTLGQQLLVQRHPQLFIRSFRGLPFSPGYPVCPDGWREAVTSVSSEFRMPQRVTPYTSAVNRPGVPTPIGELSY